MIGMFVKRTVKRRGETAYEYLALVEAVRVEGKNTHRTLFRLGEVSELRESGQLDRIVKALATYAKGTYVEAGELEGLGSPSFGAVAAAWSYFRRLGLEEHFSSLGDGRRSQVLSDTVFSMVANRLTEPSSKRRTITEWLASVALPAGVMSPSLDQCYRAIDALCEHKEATEAHLYSQLCNLANLDLRLVCYDLTSSYFETVAVGRRAFPSLAFGYSRDHRSDRPQIMIGLLVTSDGIPIAHHVFSGNTADVSTLPGVMEDLKSRFGVGRIALVADRGLISEDNLALVDAHGFDHVLATRLHHDDDVEAVLEQANAPTTSWEAVPEARSFCADLTHDSRRFVVVFSPVRYFRDKHRHLTLCVRIEDGLIAIEERVRAGRLVDPAKIGAAADRVLRSSPVGRCFVTTIRKGFFSWDFDDKARQIRRGALVRALCLHDVAHDLRGLGRTGAALLQEPAERRASLQGDEGLLVVAADVPLDRGPGARTCGALCAGRHHRGRHGTRPREGEGHGPRPPVPVDDPSPGPRSVERGAHAALSAGTQQIKLVNRRSALQAKVLKALQVDTSTWSKAEIA